VTPKKPADFERDEKGQVATVAPGMDKWDFGTEEEETEQTVQASRMRALVESPLFEIISTLLVVICVVLMAFSNEIHGRHTGYILGVPQYTSSINESMPNTQNHLEILDMIFNVLFTIELVFRLVAFKMSSFRNGWILMDLALVTSSWLFDTGAVDIAYDPMILRLFRLLRLLRLLKVLKSAKIVDTLFLLVKSIQASFGALIWSFFIIWSLQVVMAILFAQLLQSYLADGAEDLTSRQDVFLYFGTFFRTVITMFEISMGSWVPSCRLLLEKVSIWYGLFYILYRCCFMFSVLKVITAVFIAETTRCANSDDDIAITQKQIAREHYCKRLQAVFQELDIDGDGFLTREEFQPLISNHVLTTWLHTLDIDTYDLSMLFHIHDDGDGKFSISEFIDGLTHVKGPAKSIDLLKLMVSVAHLTHKMEDMQDMMQDNNPRSRSSNELVETSRDTNAKLDMLLGSGMQFKEENLLRVTEMTNSKLDTLLSAASGRSQDGAGFMDQDLAIILVKATETTNAKLDMLFTNVRLPSGEAGQPRAGEDLATTLLKATEAANDKLDKLLTRDDSFYTSM